MSRIWLRCLLVDPKTGKRLAQSDDELLPEELELRHLRSFLERRFGRPLPKGKGVTRGLAFRPPEGLRRKGADLVAMPMLRDPESGQLFPVYGRLSDIVSLAGTIDAALAEAIAGLEQREPWFGPMADPVRVRQAANDLAARAMRAWVIAEGLAAEIDAVRGGKAGSPPAPGLARLRDLARLAARGAAAAADPAWALSGTVMRCTGAVLDGEGSGTFEELQEAEAALEAAYVETRERTEEVERAARALAQLGLGVSAMLGGSERVEQLDRTCVAVLQPPDGHGAGASLLDDGVTLHAASREDLLVEIAGVVCRILVDRATVVCLEAPGPAGGRFELAVGQGDVLETSVVPAPPAAGGRGRAGRPIRPARKGSRPPLSRSWPSPVRVVEPARAAVDALFGELGLERPGDLTVSVRPSGASGEAAEGPGRPPRSHWLM